MAIRLHERFTVAPTEYGSVLLDRSSGRYFQLSRTATVVVDELVEGRTVEETVGVLHARYGVDPQVAARDVAALLARLRDDSVVVD
ncbi:lasso peptide biosynthesis PqqD family chaperone [Actinokineospora pegani]|uniref:lasso peptide biosynthesis PqqD family chaperone n=1 Tax=Actinokineospora pegani TaxID=2654637 RepID=UPI0018D469EC|nr:lasso peptide biosynthesis PqqD family chaperone [Actinokineospora pegani]